MSRLLFAAAPEVKQEPVAWWDVKIGAFNEKHFDQLQPLYTSDQLAGAVLRERERCAKVCDPYTHGQWFAAAIRSGA